MPATTPAKRKDNAPTSSSAQKSPRKSGPIDPEDSQLHGLLKGIRKAGRDLRRLGIDPKTRNPIQNGHASNIEVFAKPSNGRKSPVLASRPSKTLRLPKSKVAGKSL